MGREVIRYESLGELARDAAGRIAAWVNESVTERGSFSVALSGGSSPRRLYETLARAPYDVGVPWSHVHLFWGDERCVPPSDPRSNVGMVTETLLSRVSPPPENVHRPPTGRRSPEAAAKAYEAELRHAFPEGARRDGWPVFDLVLLGVGMDGHTASLFPADPTLDEVQRWVAIVRNPGAEPPVPRVTLTLPVFNAARRVVFLVSGRGKADAVRRILEGTGVETDSLPAARVRPGGHLLWLLDGSFL